MLSTDVVHGAKNKKQKTSYLENVINKNFASSCQFNVVIRLDKKHLQVFNECSKKGNKLNSF